MRLGPTKFKLINLIPSMLTTKAGFKQTSEQCWRKFASNLESTDENPQNLNSKEYNNSRIDKYLAVD